MEKDTRRQKKGTVVSDKMQNTVIVRVEDTIRHPKYGKVMTRAKKFYAHDATDAVKEGQVVTIAETRPLSKLKRWRVVSVES